MKKIFALSIFLLLTACGFHLKGNAPYDKLPVRFWHIEGKELQQNLENALRYANGKPVATANSQADLRIEYLNTKKDVYTITRGAKLNEYLLSMRVIAQAYRKGDAWGAPIEVQVRRTMPYADSMVLGKQEEEQTIWNELQNDAAEQIVRRLSFLPTDAK